MLQLLCALCCNAVQVYGSALLHRVSNVILMPKALLMQRIFSSQGE